MDFAQRERALEIIKPFLPKAKQYVEACLSGERWGGNALLILLDASLASTGFSYFRFVEPRVRRFQSELLDDLTLRKAAPLFQRKTWYCVTERSVEIMRSAIRTFSSSSDSADEEFENLVNWARVADPLKRSDAFSGTKGVGPFTVQYLRAQVGLDVPVPDRSVAKFLSSFYEGPLRTPAEVMRAVELISSFLGLTNLELVWSIWLYYDGRAQARN